MCACVPVVQEILATPAVDLEEAHVHAKGSPGGHLCQLLEQVAGGVFLAGRCRRRVRGGRKAVSGDDIMNNIMYRDNTHTHE